MILRRTLILAFVLLYVPALASSAPSQDLAISGLVEAQNIFTTKDADTGALRTRQIFVLLIPSTTESTSRAPVVVDMTRTRLTDGLERGMTLHIRGTHRMASAAQLTELEQRWQTGTLSNDEEELLSTAYRVLTILWRSGALPPGERPSQISWLEANPIQP